MNNKNLLPILLIGGAAFLYMNYKKQAVYSQPPIQAGTPNWTYKVQEIVKTAGGLADALFGPNGPFRNMSKSQVQNALQQNNAQYNQAQMGVI